MISASIYYVVGGDIAYPDLHKEAGGTGTYKDPITYAGTKKATKPGSIIYVNFLQKYFIMEDDCEECDHEWDRNQKWHFDLWMVCIAIIVIICVVYNHVWYCMI